MTARGGFTIAALVAGAAVLRVQAQNPPRPQQTFRATTDVVMVDVSVRDGDRAVTGLSPEDFVLTDNGVRQRIESVEPTAVPIDVTLVIDLSGNYRGPMSPRVPLSKVAGEIEAEAREVARMLRPDDRIRLLALDRHVQQIWPLEPVSPAQGIDVVEFDGLAALYDGLAAALLQPVEPARRHVVIARTKGIDTISSIEADAVRAIARRSDAQFHLVLSETAFDNDEEFSTFQCTFMGSCWPTRRFWVPDRRAMMRRVLIGAAQAHELLPDGLTLLDAARATGGMLHKTTASGVPSLAATFRRAFEDFRSGYMLRYTPDGVDRTGWHTIEVTVRGSNSYTVRARHGYGVEEVESPAPLPIPDVPQTIAELTAAYDRGAYQAVELALRRAADPVRLIRDFQAAGNPWPATPKVEAAFALELAESALFSARAATRERAYDLLGTFSRLIRHPLEPDTFELYWHFAVLTLLEGSIRPEATEPFVERALARFPDEPRFVLSRAIVADQRWAEGRTMAGIADGNGQPDRDRAETIRGQYEAAIALPGIAAEARIRLAWFLHRIGQHDEALTYLAAAAEATPEPALQYLQRLISGHALVALGRLDDAVAAYRRAQDAVPAAQSARVALMNALLMSGDRDEAEAVAEQIQIETSDRIDPWWMYWQGQYRLHPQAIGRVRELSR